MKKIRNILVITSDHFRFDSAGFCGNKFCKTPNLDRLAERSTRFNNCFTQSPVCQPARYSLASGLYPHTHGILNNERYNANVKKDLFTIAHAVSRHGFRRFNIGHMHWSNTSGDMALPVDTGYEEWITMNMWRQTLPPEVLKRFEWEHADVTRRTTGGPSTRKKNEYWGHYNAECAVQSIRSTTERNEPFLCWTSIWEPHPPFYPPADLYRGINQGDIQLPKKKPEDAPSYCAHIAKRQKEWEHLTETEVRQITAGYYGLVSLADEYIGMILKAVEDLGIADETAIIWTSDHGEQLFEHQLFTKFVFYEASVHVPLLICLPGCDPCQCPALVEHIDLFPTICDILGIACPGTVQGRSLMPLIRQERDTYLRDAVFGEIDGHRMIRTDRWKLNTLSGEALELYDLQNDPGEFYNLAEDARYRDKLDSLLSRLERWAAETA